MPVLRVPYAALVERPEEEARRIAAFLGRELSIAKMAAAVDPALYRNRSTQSAPASG